MGENFYALTNPSDAAIMSAMGELHHVAYTKAKPHPIPVADPCPVHGSHHWLLDAPQGGVIIGHCKHCRTVWPKERGKFTPVAVVTPAQYQQEGYTYLAKL